MPTLAEMLAQTDAELGTKPNSLSSMLAQTESEIQNQSTNRMVPTSAPYQESIGEAHDRALDEGGVLNYVRSVGRHIRDPLTGIGLADVGAATDQARNDLIGLGARLFGDGQMARRAERDSELAGADADTINSGVLSNAARGSVRSLIPMAMTAGLGPVAAIGTAAGIRGSQAVSEAEDAGLTGADAAGYVTRAATIEALPALVFQRLGLGGVEKTVADAWKGAASNGVKQALLQAGKSTVLQELPEGLITSAADIANQKLSKVDPTALTAEQVATTFRDVALQTLMMGGAAHAPSIVRGISSDLAANRQAPPPLPPPGAVIPPSTSPTDNLALTPEDLAAFEKLQSETPTTDPTQTIRADDGRQGFTPEELDSLKYRPTPPTSPTGPDSQGEPVVDEMLKLDPEVIGALGRLDRNAGDTVDAPIRNDINPEVITGDSTAVDIKRSIPGRQQPDETRIGAPITITPKERGPSQTDTQILPTLPDVKGMRIEQAERRVKELENRLKAFTAETQNPETTPLMRAYAKKAQDEDQAALDDMRAELAFYNEADDSSQPEEDVIDRLRAEGGIMGPDKRSAGEYDAYKALPPEVKRMVSGRKKKTEAANDGTGLARVGPVRAPGTAIDVIAKAMKDSHGYGDGTPETLVNLIQQAADNRAAKRKQAADAKIAKKNPSDEEAYRAGVPTKKKDLPPDPKEATQTIDNEVIASLQRQLDEAKAKLGETFRAPDPLAPVEKPKQPAAVKPSVKPQDKANEYINSLNLPPDEKKVAQDALVGWNSELDPNGYKGNIDSVLLFTREKAARKKPSAVAQAVQTLAAKDGKPAMHKNKVSPLTGGDPGVVAMIDPLIGTMQIREGASGADVQQSVNAMKTVPRPDLSGKQVNAEVDGSTTKVDAREATVMLRKRLAALRSILSCLE